MVYNWSMIRFIVLFMSWFIFNIYNNNYYDIHFGYAAELKKTKWSSCFLPKHHGGPQLTVWSSE